MRINEIELRYLNSKVSTHGAVIRQCEFSPDSV